MSYVEPHLGREDRNDRSPTTELTWPNTVTLDLASPASVASDVNLLPLGTRLSDWRLNGVRHPELRGHRLAPDD